MSCLVMNIQPEDQSKVWADIWESLQPNLSIQARVISRDWSDERTRTQSSHPGSDLLDRRQDKDRFQGIQNLLLFLPGSSTNGTSANCLGTPEEHLIQQQTSGLNWSPVEVETRNNYESKPKILAESQKTPGELLTIDKVPAYLRRNPYILTGYRANLSVWQCIDGIFWWTNETVNVWTHLMAFVLFVALLVWITTCSNPLISFVSTSTKVFYYSLAICFISTMLFSTLYHMFIFQSEQLYNILHTLDLIGVAFSLLGIFIAAITHGFKCHTELKTLYLSTTTGIFLIMLILSIPYFKVRDNVKKWAFFLWTAYGIVPTVHWFHIMGGLNNSLVQEVMPRLVKLYGIGIVSFFFLVSKFPERLLPGWFDIIGSSHQWWHVLIVYAYMYCFYNAYEFVNYVKNVACPDTPLY